MTEESQKKEKNREKNRAKLAYIKFHLDNERKK